MNSLFVYMVKVAIYMAAFYLVYSILLSRDTTYGRNRIFILLSLTSSFIFPLIIFQTVKPLDIQFFGKLLSEVFITASSNEPETLNSGSTTSDTLPVIYFIYIIGVILLILKLSANLINLLFLIIRKKNNGSQIIKFQGFNTAGFSAMGYIFINSRLNPQEAGEIIKHEKKHLDLNHFIDIVFIEIIKAFQWFNPVVFLFNRSLRAIHEYQADQGCLSSGVQIINYQSLLLNQVFKTRAFNLTNSFSNPSLVKKRLVMMTKKRTSSLANMKLLLVLPVIGLVFLAISAYREIPDTNKQNSDPLTLTQTSSSLSATTQSSPVSLPPSSLPENKSESIPATSPPPPPPPKSSESNKTTGIVAEENIKEAEIAPFVVVEEMPKFPGGDNELLKYIAGNTQYPAAAKANKIQGRVIIRFCVTENGAVNRISVLKGVDPELDKEAIRVVETLPAFEPGRQGGKAVPVWYMVPISFTIK
jgi:TonB family protein